MKKLILILLLSALPLLGFSQRILENVRSSTAVTYKTLESKGDTVTVNFNLVVQEKEDKTVTLTITNMRSFKTEDFVIVKVVEARPLEKVTYYLYEAFDKEKVRHSVSALYDKKSNLLKIGVTDNKQMVIFLINSSDQLGL